MEQLFAFFIRASAGIMLFYLVYWFLLRKETFYNANRWFLLGALISSVLLPLFPVKFPVLVEPEQQTIVFQALNDTFLINNTTIKSGIYETSASIGWKTVFLAVYLTGASLFFVRLFTQTAILISLLIRCKIKAIEGIRVVENEKYGLPFSFFNVVFINPKFHTQEDLKEILAHEKVHIRENHWFDLLFIELLTVIFWFNPFIWFFERSIKQNHEYLADKGVISIGCSVDRYQELLINQLLGTHIIGVTNYLNFALNTNRLKMMTKNRTSGLRRVKFLVALPVLAAMFFACAEFQYKVVETERNIDEEHEKVFKDKIKLNAEVVDEHNKTIPGVNVIIKGTTLGTISDPEGKIELDISSGDQLVLSYVGKETIFDDLSGILTEKPVQGKYFRKYVMQEGVFNIIREEHFAKPSPPLPVRKKTSRQPGAPVEKSQSGEEEEIFFIVEEMPVYPGGFYELGRYIKEMEHKLSREQNLKGKALIGFTIDESGKVSGIRILEKDNDAVASGAMYIATKMIYWTPGQQRGKPVPVHFTLPFEF